MKKLWTNILGVILISVSIVTSGCMGMPGSITVTESSFDKSVQLSMEPAMVYKNNDGFSGSLLQLALMWKSTMKDDKLVLIAYVDGAKTIPSKESLHFNIDGDVISLSSIDTLTDIKFEPGVYSHVYVPGNNVSSKRYLITKGFLNRLLASKDVRVKLDLDKTSVDGVFTDRTMSSAYLAFEEFQKKMDNFSK